MSRGLSLRYDSVARIRHLLDRRRTDGKNCNYHTMQPDHLVDRCRLGARQEYEKQVFWQDSCHQLVMACLPSVHVVIGLTAPWPSCYL